VLDEAGLDSAIEWYLPTVEKQVGLTISYERSGLPATINGAASIHVYRVLQEALTNVIRHAGASHAWVRLRHDEHVLELEVEDRGTGFKPSGGRGLGLVAMRERADLLGGTIEFDSPSGGGTLVKLRVPSANLQRLAGQRAPTVASDSVS
jgi:signal transduction histidine kinase